MTVPSEVSLNQYTANGSTTVFAYTFTIKNSDDLTVYFDGIEQTSGFTVSGVGTTGGGSVTFGIAPLADVTVTLLRSTSTARTNDYQNSGPMRSDTLDADFDDLWRKVQDLERKLSYEVFRFNESQLRTPAINTLPAPSTNSVLAWAANGSLQNTALSVSQTALTNVSVSDRAALRTLLASFDPTDDADKAGTSILITDTVYGGVFVIKQDTAGAGIANDDGLIITETGSTTATDEFYAQRVNYDKVNVKWFGATGDGSTDDYQAIIDAVEAISTFGSGYYISGPTLFFPNGEYRCSQTLDLKKIVRFEGENSGMLMDVGKSKIKFDEGVNGIVINMHNTINGGIESPATTLAAGSIIDGIHVEGGGGSTADGIWLRGRALVTRTTVTDFSGNGIQVVATSGGSASVEGNANNSIITHCKLNDNGDAGLYLDGADANSCHIEMVSCKRNTNWGIYDSSFLGNTFINCHVDGNGASYKADDPNNRCVFVGCYTENGQGNAEVDFPAVIIGGLFGDNDGTAPQFKSTAQGAVIDKFLRVPGIELGYEQDDDSGYSMLFYDTAGTFDWRFAKATGRWGYKWANLGDPKHIMFYDRAATTANGYARNIDSSAPGGDFGFLGIGEHYAGAHTQMFWRGFGTAAPTTGTWRVNDYIENTSPTAGGYSGWKCVTAGTPGTWKGVGLIES